MQTCFQFILPQTGEYKIPEIPDPDTLPELVALDTENNDPYLNTRDSEIAGPSWLFKSGHVCGISAAWKEPKGLRSVYFPVGHQHGPNMEKGLIFRWVSDLIKKPRRILFHNSTYDLGWLYYSGVPIHQSPCRFTDIMVMRALLQEEAPSHSLAAVSREILGKAKDESSLRQAAEAHDLNPKKDLWRLHPKYVAPYAEQDAALLIQLFDKLWPQIEEEKLQEILALEEKVSVVLTLMSARGIRVDLDASEQLMRRFQGERNELIRRLGGLDVWSNKDVTRYLTEKGVQLPRTAAGGLSANKDILAKLSKKYPEAEALLKARQMDRLAEVYIRKKIIEASVNGRIHPQFIQMAREDGGTRTGRLSAKNPNPQQVPKRSKEGKLLRSLYLPEEGCLWGKMDYWSQEPTLQLHYALRLNLPGAAQAAEYHRQKKKLYAFIEQNVPGVTYDEAKMLVLAIAYGFGVEAFAEFLETTKERASELLEKFNNYIPYLSLLAAIVNQKARETGKIRTIGGRIRHFDYWEPAGRDRYGTPIYGHQAAEAAYGRAIRRAHTRKAFNSLIQGGGGDMTKKAAVDYWLATGDVPLLQVHDELDFNLEKPEDAKLAESSLVEAYSLTIPVFVDVDIGPTWQ